MNRISAIRFKEANEGKWADLVVRVPERTLSQLRMYRAWLTDVANHTGNDTESLHEFLLEKLAPRVVKKIRGKKGEVEVTQMKRTSGGHSLSMEKLEMGEYMDKAAELTGYPLPTKEELRKMGYFIE